MYSNVFRALLFKKDAFAKLAKHPHGLYYFLAFSALLTILFLPLAVLVVSLKSIYGGAGPLTAVMPGSFAPLLIALFLTYFVVTVALGFFFVYVLHLFSTAFGSRAHFKELLSVWAPALLPLCITFLPLFIVLVYGTFGGNMSDSTGYAVGILFNILLLVMPLVTLVYTAFMIHRTAKLSWGKAIAVTLIALFVLVLVLSATYFLFVWLI